MVKDERCHDKCTQQGAHSVCLASATLKTPILQQMIHKLTTLRYSRQNTKRFGQYANVEKIFKSGSNTSAA